MRNVWIFVIVMCFTVNVKAQDVRALIAEGIQLNNNKDYAGAVTKYQAALSSDPGNVSAKYQMAFALNALGKGADALPFLQDVVRASPSPTVTASAFGLMASIYDRSGLPLKAIESYKKALETDSTSYTLQYGLGLAYFRAKQYQKAEEAAIRSHKLDVTKAETIRLYALVTFHQDERAPAFLALCHFLWMEPNGSRSAEANENIANILQGGMLKKEHGTGSNKIEGDSYMLNRAITKAVNDVAKQNHTSKQDLFRDQLQAIFLTLGNMFEKPKTDDGFTARLARLYKKLGQSANMTAFAYYIRQQTDKNAAAWITAHPNEVNALKQWMETAGNFK